MFYKNNRTFPLLKIASSKHEEGWVNLRQLCKPEIQVCISVSNSPNPLCVQMRVGKHGKIPLLIKWFVLNASAD